MVLQKRLDYGFNGYQVPAMPRATRSARRRVPINRRVEATKMCAFDLLATVAGSLLLEKGDSSTSVDANDKSKDLKASSFPPNDDHSGFTSVTVVSKTSDDREIKNEIGSPCSQIGEGSPIVYKESGVCKLDCEASVTSVKDESNNKVLIGDGPDQSDRVTKAPLSSIPSSRDDVKIVSRDDDENSSGCYHPRTTRTRSKFFKQAPRIGDRRIRKILASKYWRPKYKDEAHSNPDGILKPIYRNRKDGYNKRQRSQMAIPFKKRKLYDQRDYFNPSEKGNIGASDSRFKGQGGNGTSFQRRDSHVKLRIKSFRVPELFIEIPETATVGSLKRTVMEAVTAILGGELHIGILLQGQKVKDDNVTLLQSGISHDDQLDSLGFTLEPNPSQSPDPLCAREPSHFLAGDESQPLIRYPSGPAMVEQGASAASPESDEPSSGHFGESDHDSAPSPTDMSVDKSCSDSKALVPVPEMNVEALAVVPAHRKLKRSEMSQRRIRRPFSVTEVEALVQAVEKLGTGRWRDVKLRAFDDAMHRTYVDLKDKWKTLVHTARISPQQRRGEPVPQELLDRVLNAHAYWSQHQAKQHSDPCLLL